MDSVTTDHKYIRICHTLTETDATRIENCWQKVILWWVISTAAQGANIWCMEWIMYNNHTITYIYKSINRQLTDIKCKAQETDKLFFVGLVQ